MMEKYINGILDRATDLESRIEAKKKLIEDLNFEISLFEQKRKETYRSLGDYSICNLLNFNKFKELQSLKEDEKLSKELKEFISYVLWSFMKQEDIDAFKPKYVSITQFLGSCTVWQLRFRLKDKTEIIFCIPSYSGGYGDRFEPEDFKYKFEYQESECSYMVLGSSFNYEELRDQVHEYLQKPVEERMMKKY